MARRSSVLMGRGESAAAIAGSNLRWLGEGGAAAVADCHESLTHVAMPGHGDFVSAAARRETLATVSAARMDQDKICGIREHSGARASLAVGGRRP